MKKLFIFLLLILILCSCAKVQTEVAPVGDSDLTFYLDEVKEVPQTESLEEKYSRYYDEFVGEFIVSDDYGEVVPFVGSKSFTQWNTYENRYGFCTLDGEIVCDAVYGYVSSVYTDNYTYYLMRIPAEPEELKGEEYPSVYNEETLLVRSDGKKAVQLNCVEYAGIFADKNYVGVEERVFDGQYYSSKYTTFNEDLEPVNAKVTHNKTSPQFYGVCGGCNVRVTLDTPIIESGGYYSNDFIVIGYVHNNCNGKTSVITPKGKLIVNLPQCGRVYNEDVFEDYFVCTLADSADYTYSTEDDTAFIYNRVTKETITLPGYNVVLRTGKNSFLLASVTQNEEGEYTQSFSYDTQTKKFSNLATCHKAGKNYTIVVSDGVSTIKDKDYSDIIRIRFNED